MELGQVSSPLSGASIKSKGRLFFLMNKCSCANVTQIGRNLPRRILPGIEGDQDINACKTNVPIQSRSVSWVPVVCPALIHPSGGAPGGGAVREDSGTFQVSPTVRNRPHRLQNYSLSRTSDSVWQQSGARLQVFPPLQFTVLTRILSSLGSIT